MQLIDGQFVYSATDLNNYLECGHLVALERLVARGERVRPDKDPTVALIAEKGNLHEQAYLARLRELYPDLVEIPNTFGREGIDAAADATIRAMDAGASIIYQGTFFDGTFLGKSDFLMRVERPSARWAWSYEVADTKLALQDKPYFIVQLAHYSEHVARVQGSDPVNMHVVLGNKRQKSFRVADYAAYYRNLKASFLARGAEADAYPVPVPHCTICTWSADCDRRRRADDHLSLVANMRRDQTDRFEHAGIATLAQLGNDQATRPYGMAEDTFTRLHRQASLQLRGRENDTYVYELLEHRRAVGFGLMPAPAAGDVFFDMEGDQFFEIGVGLEYLFGFYCPGDEVAFKPFWGTDRAAEKTAFEAAIDFIIERRADYPAMHVYHYAPYEKTALRKLSQRHATREDEVDDLLRGEVLVDLYAVVRQSVAVSQPSYSIKKLEPFYGMKRTAAVKKGDDSILMFEEWLADQTKTAILDDIAKYNEEDCVSTHLLRDWLLKLHTEYVESRSLASELRSVRKPDELCHAELEPGCKSCAKRDREGKEAQKVSEDQRRLAALEHDPSAVLLSHLLSYHRREDKPVWWKMFDRCENIDDLLEFDHEAIGGLTLLTDIEPYKNGKNDKHLVFTFSFPEQNHQFGAGDAAHDPTTKKTAGTIVALDVDNNTACIKRGGTLEDAMKLVALIPGGPIGTEPQKKSLARVAESYLDGTFANAFPAARDILACSPPRLIGRATGSRVQPERVSPQSVYDAVIALDRSYLLVQGPPGTGKTYTGARVIVELLRAGKRVGVMANAHKAIHNMLHEVESYAQSLGLDATAVRGVHKHSGSNEGSRYVSNLAKPLVGSLDSNDLASGDCNLLSGNGWFFSREEMALELDYLFIDEAGQTALADAIAVAPSAQNIVLLGDPMQLAQVSQGYHPADAGLSVLSHLLAGSPTIKPERGILLDVSYRMEPSICTFISDTSYESRLHAEPKTANNRIFAGGLDGAGLRYLPVEHRDNGRESIEEANAIAAQVATLLRGEFVRKDEPRTHITERDILVVTPYNAQRKRIGAALKASGFAGVRVGTVDKFQGQEAPVVFYSMATSSGEDMPRNMEFLFEKNRFNVAVSRAQCMSILVCSPALLDVRCASSGQIELVNTVCRYVEDAVRVEARALIGA